MKYTINKKNGSLYLTEEDEFKLNANCPASEKSGEGPGSCGGSKGGEKNGATDKSYKSSNIDKPVDITKDPIGKVFGSKEDKYGNTMAVSVDDNGNKTISLSNTLADGTPVVVTRPITNEKMNVSDARALHAEMKKELNKNITELKKKSYEKFMNDVGRKQVDAFFDHKLSDKWGTKSKRSKF